MTNMCCAGPQLVKATFTGLNGSGNVMVPGVKAGDIVLAVSSPTLGTYAGTNGWVSEKAPADDTITQSSGGDFSAYEIIVVLVRFI